MERFIYTILALSLAGTVPAVILILANRFLGKRIYSAFVYYAWLLVLLRFILPVPGLLRISVPVTSSAVSAAARSSLTDERNVRDHSPADTQYIPYTPVTGYNAESKETLEAQSSGNPGNTVNTEHTESQNTETENNNDKIPVPIWVFAFFVWAAGAVFTAAWNFYGYYSYRRILYKTLKPAQERDMRILNALHPWPWPVLYRSGAVSSPLLMGPVRPVIILPEREYTSEMLDGILRHELTHYRRGDLIVKWFASAVCCVHWFNPIVYFIRTSLDRACELSCDERLLKNMDRHEKQNYGEMLLALAATRPLPRRVVAVSFATEKRNLKERLVQIMTFRKKGLVSVAIMLAVLVLLVGCAAAAGPGKTPVDDSSKLSVADQTGSGTDINAPVPGGEKIYADSVDSFLAALGSDRTVILRDGTYDLTQASDYGVTGTSDSYCWEEVFDGYELVIRNAERLAITGGSGAGAVSIVTQPRYANVFKFESCREITVDGVTAGHTPEQGECCGGVLSFNGCSDISVSGSVLYGCGTLGVDATKCRRVFVDNTTIKECSYGAVQAQDSFDVRFTNGRIYDCGLKNEDYRCFDLLYVSATTGFAIHNTEIYGNNADIFLNSSNSACVEMRGCKVHDNRFGDGFVIMGKSPVADGCSFDGNTVESSVWYADPSRTAVDKNGNEITEEELARSKYAKYTENYNGPVEEDPADVSFKVDENGRKVYHVKDVDEFLSVIGSNRDIYLDSEKYDLSTASGYGGYGGSYYYWQDNFDGPGLVITGVENMRIVGKGASETTVEALPRYAVVLSFYGCRNVTVENLTAGHIREAGSCSGDVVYFQGCDSCEVLSCGLFGCGVNGVQAYLCSGLTVKDTEIYECSGYGAVISDSNGVFFEDSSIHDCGRDQIFVPDNSYVTWNGKTENEAPEMFANEWE